MYTVVHECTRLYTVAFAVRDISLNGKSRQPTLFLRVLRDFAAQNRFGRIINPISAVDFPG